MKTNLVRFLTVALLAAASLAVADEAAVTAADDARVAAFKKADTAALAEIFSADLSYAHSTGVVDTKDSLTKAIGAGVTKYQTYDYVERKFTFPAPGIALMAGKAHVQAQTAKGQMDSILSFLAVWKEEGGKWKFLAWQSARLPAPEAK